MGHPIDLVKVRQQTAAVSTSSSSKSLKSSSSTIGMLRTIFVTEGIPGLYRGVAPPLLAVTPAFAISFWSYELACRTLRDYSSLGKHDPLTVPQTAIAGGFSGICLAAIVGPSERIKCLMQVDKGRYSGFYDCLRSVYREGGLRSVFRGTGSTICRDVPGNAAYFGAYETFKGLSCELEGREQPSILGTLLSGGCAGVSNWIVAIPFDTVKSRWQTAPTGTYSGLIDVFRTTVEKEGASALFRGLSASLLRAFPANAACILGYETVKELLE